MMIQPDFAYRYATDHRADLERQAGLHRLARVAMRPRRRHQRRPSAASINVVGLPPPRAGRDVTPDDQRVA